MKKGKFRIITKPQIDLNQLSPLMRSRKSSKVWIDLKWGNK